MCIITGTWLHYVRVFAIANPSVVCNVRAPYSGRWNFRQYFFTILYLSHPLISLQNFYGDRPRGTPRSEALNARGVAKDSDVTFGYLISWWVSSQRSGALTLANKSTQRIRDSFTRIHTQSNQCVQTVLHTLDCFVGFHHSWHETVSTLRHFLVDHFLGSSLRGDHDDGLALDTCCVPLSAYSNMTDYELRLQGGPKSENTAFCLSQAMYRLPALHKIVGKNVKSFKQDVQCVRHDL